MTTVPSEMENELTEELLPPREMLLALVNPVEGRDEAFRPWYWETHIPEVLGLPGFVAAQRYRASTDAPASVSHRYATIYAVEGSASSARDLLFGAGLGMSPDLDLSSMVFVPFLAEGKPVLP
ncbi:hypothetical protein J2Y41_004369 [Arthrobacter sp. 1088]|uniref:DUF4286 family protein n=1 Tax=Arthrobacter sp. 1088 TaxID=2817768 RepID=UPI00285E572E|nr:DUF4286 family protein [Arthrobacter sp. 1088]MDR6688773.1 hypothetical protein [Arthrobacter sp. 1088]